MSYCRWSSDDFNCDAYVYESACGFEIHVAGSRIVFQTPLPPKVPFAPETIDAFVARAVAVTKLVDAAERVPIDLPHAGDWFTCASADECADKLVELQALGYRIPQTAIDTLRAEAAEDKADARLGERER